MKLKTEFIREQFPTLRRNETKHFGFFENAGGSYVCRQVMDAHDKYWQKMRVQPNAPYPISKKAGKAMQAGYDTLAAILNVDVEAVHIGPSTSQNTYVLAQAFADFLPKGANIIVTNQDHEANSGPWRRLKARGFEIREWCVSPETGELNEAVLWSLVDDNTKLLAFPHASNIVGSVNPVAEICKKAKEKNVLTCVDGVSFAPHEWPDITALGCDIYLFSSYKTYGPHQGVMVVRPELARALPNQGHEFNDEYLQKRLTPAGPDHAQIATCAGLGDYIEAVFEKQFKDKSSLSEMAREVSRLQRAHETELLSLLMEALEKRPVRVLGTYDAALRVPTVSIYQEGMKGVDAAKALAAHGIMASGGHFYAPRVLEATGIPPENGVLRVSFVHYTSEKEVKALIKALKKTFD